jgi:uncharacterized coiled-coil protein SlyX
MTGTTAEEAAKALQHLGRSTYLRMNVADLEDTIDALHKLLTALQYAVHLQTGHLTANADRAGTAPEAAAYRQAVRQIKTVVADHQAGASGCQVMIRLMTRDIKTLTKKDHPAGTPARGLNEMRKRIISLQGTIEHIGGLLLKPHPLSGPDHADITDALAVATAAAEVVCEHIDATARAIYAKAPIRRRGRQISTLAHITCAPLHHAVRVLRRVAATIPPNMTASH